MNRLSIVATACLFVLFGIAGISSALKGTPAPAVETYFLAPEDGNTLKSPVKVVFGLRGMGIAPAGVERDGTGHHHLLIDVEPLSGDALMEAIPSDENHRHFGGGQTETTIDLEPGTHTMQIVLGDHNHIPHDPPVMSQRIRIIVK